MTSKEALLDIKKRNEALKKEGHFHIGETAMKVIEQLVERDTPIKPIVNVDLDGNTKYNCPKCVCTLNLPLREINGCPKCLQRLDWS